MIIFHLRTLCMLSLNTATFYWSICTKPRKCLSGIHFVSMYDFSSGFWICSDSVVFFLLHFLILILTSLHLYGNITILFNHSTVVLEIIKYLINSSIYAYLVYICNLNSFEIIQLFKHIYYIKISDYLEIKIRRVPHVEQ